MASVQLRAEIQKQLTAALIAAGAPNYVAMLVDPTGGATTGAFLNPVRILMVQNLTDVTLQFSFEGVNDHFVLPANGFQLLDLMTNQQDTASGFFVATNTTIFVQEIGSPTTGNVYVSAYYAQGD